MDALKIEIEIPQMLAEYIDVNDEDYKKKIKQIMLYELVKGEKISLGRAAEAMEMRKIDFIKDLFRMDIAYFDQTVDEVIEDAKIAALNSGDK